MITINYRQGRSNSDDRWFRQISAGKIVSIAQTPIAKNEGNPVVSYQFTVEGDFPWAEGLSTSIAVPQNK